MKASTYLASAAAVLAVGAAAVRADFEMAVQSRLTGAFRNVSGVVDIEVAVFDARTDGQMIGQPGKAPSVDLPEGGGELFSFVARFPGNPEDYFPLNGERFVEIRVARPGEPQKVLPPRQLVATTQLEDFSFNLAAPTGRQPGSTFRLNIENDTADPSGGAIRGIAPIGRGVQGETQDGYGLVGKATGGGAGVCALSTGTGPALQVTVTDAANAHAAIMIYNPDLALDIATFPGDTLLLGATDGKTSDTAAAFDPSDRAVSFEWDLKAQNALGVGGADAARLKTALAVRERPGTNTMLVLDAASTNEAKVGYLADQSLSFGTYEPIAGTYTPRLRLTDSKATFNLPVELGGGLLDSQGSTGQQDFVLTAVGDGTFEWRFSPRDGGAGSDPTFNSVTVVDSAGNLTARIDGASGNAAVNNVSVGGTLTSDSVLTNSVVISHGQTYAKSLWGIDALNPTANVDGVTGNASFNALNANSVMSNTVTTGDLTATSNVSVGGTLISDSLITYTVDVTELQVSNTARWGIDPLNPTVTIDGVTGNAAFNALNANSVMSNTVTTGDLTATSNVSVGGTLISDSLITYTVDVTELQVSNTARWGIDPLNPTVTIDGTTGNLSAAGDASVGGSLSVGGPVTAGGINDRVSTGSAGQVYTANGDGTASWQDAAGGAGTDPTLNSLTVTGSSTLGDDPATDTVTIAGDVSHTGNLGVSGDAGVGGSLSVGNPTDPDLKVDSSLGTTIKTAFVNSLTALEAQISGDTDTTALRVTGLNPNSSIPVADIANFASGGTALRTTGNLEVDGDINVSGSVNQSSDARFKTHVEELDGGLDIVRRLRGVRFDWRREEFPERRFADRREIGFIAQEIQEALPEVVERGPDGYFAVDYGKTTAVLAEAVKELDQLLVRRDSQIESQQRQIESLRQRLERLEAALPADVKPPTR